MDEQPNTAELVTPRRRRFQFSLRTLLIVSAIACTYVGWNAITVRDRKAMLEFNLVEDKDRAIPLIRKWMGDHFCGIIVVKNVADIQRFKAVFPESDIAVLPPPATPPPPPPPGHGKADASQNQ